MSPNDSVFALKSRISKTRTFINLFQYLIRSNSGHLSVDRILLRQNPKGEALKDEAIVGNLGLSQGNAQLFMRDLGPQIAWKTVNFRPTPETPFYKNFLR